VRLHARFAGLIALLACGASAALATTTTRPAARMVVPFIEDDYTRAVAEARARKVPLFVEAWAPW